MSDYWVIYSNGVATVSGPGPKPKISSGRIYGPYNTLAEAQQGAQLAEQNHGGSASLGQAVGTAVNPSTLASGPEEGCL